jgi:pimeloyl-ACP methyl ester carboxylesterase
MKRRTQYAAVTLLLALGCGRPGGQAPVSDGAEAERFGESYVVTPEGVRLYVRVVGSGPDTVIVPLGMYLAREFGPLTPGRTLIFFDPRSRGGSDAVLDSTRLGIEREVEDIEFIRETFGVTRVSLIGWSYMGAVVALYAADHPDRVRRVVQVGPTAPTTELGTFEGTRGSPPDSADRAFIDGLVQEGRPAVDPVGYCREYLMRMMIRPMMGRPESAARMKADPCVYWNEWPSQVYRTLRHVRSSEWDYSERARLVSAPVLTIHGTADPNAAIEGGRAWAALIPNARLVEIEGVGHGPWLEASDHFFGEVDAFLGGG